MAEWKLYKGATAPQCTKCGMFAGFSRYRRKNGLNARDITDFCSHCGAKMTSMPNCKTCKEANNGKWNDNGICFACRMETYVYGRPNRIAEEYKIERNEVK